MMHEMTHDGREYRRVAANEWRVICDYHQVTRMCSDADSYYLEYIWRRRKR